MASTRAGPRPDRPEPDRPAPHRDGADRAVQLPVRPPRRRHVHPPARGHRRGPRHGRLRARHPRGPPLARDRLGRGPGGRRRGCARAVRAVPPDAAPAALRGGGRSGSSRGTSPTPATARPRSSTPTGRPRRRRSCRPATSAAARTSRRRSGPRARPRAGAAPSDSASGQGVVAFDDIVRGQVEIDAANLGGDFVIVRADGTPLYHFTVVVDDAAMEISHVIRGEDHLSQHAEAHPPVPGPRASGAAFAHLPLILNPDRTKMSKRKSQTAISDYLAQGFIREALVNYLALLGWSTGTEEEILSLDELDRAVRPRARPEGRRGLRPRAARVAERPVDPPPRSRRPRRPAAAVPRGRAGPGRIDRMPTDEELRALLPIIQERLPRSARSATSSGSSGSRTLPVDPAIARAEALGRGDDARRAWRPPGRDRRRSAP